MSAPNATVTVSPPTATFSPPMVGPVAGTPRIAQADATMNKPPPAMKLRLARMNSEGRKLRKAAVNDNAPAVINRCTMAAMRDG